MKVHCTLCKTETEVEKGEWTCSICGMRLSTGTDTQGKEWTQVARWTGKAMEYKLRQDAKAVLVNADWLRDHAESFPDLYQHTNRWNKERWVSKEANAKVTHCDIGHNCGCCYDSPVEVWPYCEVDGKRIYSDPPKFTVGEKSSSGDRAFAGWARLLRTAGISETVIGQVKIHFEWQIARRREELESELASTEDAAEQAELKAEMEAVKKEEDEY